MEARAWPVLAVQFEKVIRKDGDQRYCRLASMATSGKGTGIVGYNVQAAVDTKNHLAHEVTNVGHDRGQLSKMDEQAQDATGHDAITVIADRGYFKGEDILACEQGGMTPYVPKRICHTSLGRRPA
jgi:hypothetical protein